MGVCIACVYSKCVHQLPLVLYFCSVSQSFKAVNPVGSLLLKKITKEYTFLLASISSLLPFNFMACRKSTKITSQESWETTEAGSYLSLLKSSLEGPHIGICSISFTCQKHSLLTQPNTNSHRHRITLILMSFFWPFSLSHHVYI